jgi:hypothetical protein
MLSVLLDPILPVFAIMFIGFFAGRFGKVTNDEARILNTFAMTVLLPIFIFPAKIAFLLCTLLLPPTRFRPSFWQFQASQVLWPFRWRSFILSAQTRSYR